MAMRQWDEMWNNVIRYVIFQDDELKKLMLLPEKTNIVQFIDRYFIEAAWTNKLLENEDVRILYADASGADTSVPNVRRNIMTFDIYVKMTELRNATNDRLALRTKLIAARIDELLRKNEYILKSGYKFMPAGAWPSGTRTAGYARYTIAFYYMKVF